MYISRILPIFAIAISVLSCSSGNDSVIDPDPNPSLQAIAFGGKGGTWQDAQTSRATTTPLENFFNSFRTWGYKTNDDYLTATQVVMDRYIVQHNNDNGADSWDYVGINNPTLSSATQTLKYWDYSATSYRFVAHSPADANITQQITSGIASSQSLELTYPYEYSSEATSTTVPYISELWLTEKEATGNEYGKCVTMTFVPIIAKVRIKFSYPEATKKIAIKNIHFSDTRFTTTPDAADTPLRGSLKASYPLTGKPSSAMPQLSWTPAIDNPSGSLILSVPYELKNDPIHILSDTTQYEKWYYVPPLDIIPYEQGAYTMSAIIDGNYASTTVPAQFMQWKAGYQYTYIFKITEAGTLISFADMQMEQWLPGTDIDNRGSGTESW